MSLVARRLLFVLSVVVVAALLVAVSASASLAGYSYDDTPHPVHGGYDHAANLAPGAVDDDSDETHHVWPLDGAGAILASSGVSSAPRAPALKPGSAGGPTASNRFPQSVRGRSITENVDEFGEVTCVYCRMGTSTPHVDHVIPRVRGGNATLDNAQVTCPWCNLSKGARDFPVNPPPGYRGQWPPPWWGLE